MEDIQFLIVWHLSYKNIHIQGHILDIWEWVAMWVGGGWGWNISGNQEWEGPTNSEMRMCPEFSAPEAFKKNQKNLDAKDNLMSLEYVYNKI